MARERLNPFSRRRLLVGAGAMALLAACGQPESAPSTTPAPTAVPPAAAPPAVDPAPGPGAEGADPGGATKAQIQLVPLAEDEQEAVSTWIDDGWQTDFSIKSVHLSEVTQAAAKRDIIPPIDEPKFIPAAEVGDNLPGNEPVAVLQVEDQVRAYPLRILTFHEIVNDEVAGVPVASTFCPLCNTAIGFRRQIQGQTLRMGVSANLRASNLLMWDDVTESWWQQSTGEAIVGTYTGWRLAFLPMAISSFDTFLESYPDGPVLTEETGHVRRYGSNPYVGYDSGNRKPFLFFDEIDERLPATERVIVVEIGDEQVAYPFSTLVEARVVHDRVGGEDIVVLFTPGTASALGAGTIAEARDVGAAGVFRPRLNGQDLQFLVEDGLIVDDQTGSTWNSLGLATAGEFSGRGLTPVVHGNDFWFSWAALRENVRIYQA